MRIKRIITLALCALMAVLLVSCGEQEIGSYLDKYDYKEEVIEDVVLDMYIIVGDETHDNAITSVKTAINKHTAEAYHTTININYVKASEYETKVVNAVASGNADIVLINSTALMDSLIADAKLADLATYLDTTDFGKLNTQIADALLEGAYDGEKLYCIPNNHIIGQYEYIVINKAVAQGVFNYNDEKLAGIVTPEDADKLWSEIEAKKGSYDSNLQKDDVVKNVIGNYQARFDIEDGWICNVYKCPKVDKDEVCLSAFAITAACDKPERAMEIVYAINTDEVLRNLLLYGEEGKNYTVDTDGFVVPVDSGENVYRMNILYTGDMFKAYYTKSDLLDFKFDSEIKNYGEIQNDDASVAVVAE